MSTKTELPTRRKLRQAREDGQVAHSKDVTETVMIIALFGYIIGQGDEIARDFVEMILMPRSVAGMPFEAALDILANGLLRRGASVLAPFLGIVIGVGLLVEFTQTGFLIAPKAFVPFGKKLNVVKNVQNIFSAKTLVDFLKSNLKILLLSAVVYGVLRNSLSTLVMLPEGGLPAVGVATAQLLKAMLIQVSLGYAVLAAADYAWQRFDHVRQLKMTKEEVKRERKDDEGDPKIKHKRRELHKELLENQQVENTKHASAVVTNPTHIAVAIAYRKELTPLPIVMSKGEGELAQRIMEVARRHDIPVLQNIPLARALMATAEIDRYVPTDLLEPVAEVLRFVRDMKAEGDAAQ
jgi:type III secretion protein U